MLLYLRMTSVNFITFSANKYLKICFKNPPPSVGQNVLENFAFVHEPLDLYIYHLQSSAYALSEMNNVYKFQEI